MDSKFEFTTPYQSPELTEYAKLAVAVANRVPFGTDVYPICDLLIDEIESVSRMSESILDNLVKMAVDNS